jgi:hypothetical protein
MRITNIGVMLKSVRSKLISGIIIVFTMLGLSIACSYVGYAGYRYGFWGNPISFSVFQSEYPFCNRLFSHYLSTKIIPKDEDISFRARRAGLWYGTWFFLCCLVYIFLYETKHVLFLMFGTFGALCYGFVPATDHIMLPWDMPALFFFTLICGLTFYRRPEILIPIIIVGTGFKETVMVCSFVFAQMKEIAVRQRIYYIIISVSGCLWVKTTLNIVSDNTIIPHTLAIGGWINYNIEYLLTPKIFHPIFVNAGTLISLLLIIVADKSLKNGREWTPVIFLFLLGIFLHGRISEYRIFYEMIPISLAIIANEWDRINASSQHRSSRGPVG